MGIALIVIPILLLANGMFALAELAIVSSRRPHLRKLATRGNARAATALALAESPSRFLSAIQLGINLVGSLISVLAGATLSDPLAHLLAPLAGPSAGEIAIGIVVASITVLTVFFGELIPKRIALSHPERYALLVARPMRLLTRLGTPVVWLMSTATDNFMRLFGLGDSARQKASDEEVALLLEQGQSEGVFHAAEKRMVEGVLALDRLPVTAIMTPRPKIVWLNAEDPDDVNWRKIVANGHSHFPVYRKSTDNVAGMISVKALWANSAAGFNTPLPDLLAQPLRVRETVSCIQVLETFKRSGRHIALVTSASGAICGLVTLIDVLEAIVGDLPARGEAPGTSAIKRADGSWLIDASLPVSDLKKLLELPSLPGEEHANFQTLGGFLMTNFGRIPNAGDAFEAGSFRWEVVDMDHFRIDKVWVVPLARIPREGAASDSADGTDI